MAVVGQAEVLVVPKTDQFGRQLQTQLGSTGAAAGKFGGIVDSLESKVRGLGITSADVAIILGAGLAGGAAFAAREVIQFVGASIEASSALHEQEAATRQVFEANSELVESFAEGAAAIGLSERAALQATNVFGGFFQNIGLGTEASAKLATGFTSLAAELGSFFDEAPETVIQRLISGLRGEQEAVEQLNVNISEGIVLQRAIAEGFGKTADEISLGEKVFARALIIFEQTSKAQGDLARNADSLAAAQRRANAEFENAKAAFGDALQPIATFVVETGADFLNMLRGLNDGFQRFSDEAERATKQVTLFGFGFRTHIEGRETNALEKLRDIVFGFDGAAEDATDTTEELGGALDELEDPINKAAIATEKLNDAIDAQVNARTRLNRAIGDAERRVDRAETTLARAFEDSELRVDAAERALAEAFEDRSERIAAAEAKLVQVRLTGFRDVRNARERLADFEIESERRVIEAQRRILELRQEQARAISNAQLSVQEAQRRGDAEAENRAARELALARDSSDIRDAQRDALEEANERDRERDQLERDLAEAKKDRIRAIKEAEADLAQTSEDAAERIADAQRRLEDAHRDSARAIADAQRGVSDAFRDGAESVADAQTALEKYAHDAEIARTATQLLDKDMAHLADTATTLKNILNAPVTGDNGGQDVNPDGTIGGGGLLDGLNGILGQPSSSPTDNFGRPIGDPKFGADRSMVVNINVPHQDPRVLANAISYRLGEEVW